MAPSPYWGAEPIWDSQTSIHNQMMDEKGRVWSAARIRPPANPDFCKAGLRSSVGEGISAADRQSPSVDL